MESTGAQKDLDGYVILPNGQSEHRVVCEKAHGYIPYGWHVHHVNFIRDDNRPENLIALPAEVHRKLHLLMKVSGLRYSREIIEAKLKAARKMRAKSPNCATCRKKRRNCRCQNFVAAWRIHWPKTAVNYFSGHGAHSTGKQRRASRGVAISE